MPNRLAREKSPYLLQHAENPVDWYPWGSDALAQARAANVPILLSVGYSACHWCHVMAHESFEDPETAKVMNAHFVNIKVDREERPDVDAIYMEAVQAMIGQGGWPLNVFLTPDGRPFFGGTYFPPAPRHGMPSWRQVLESVSTAFRERGGDIEHNAETVTAYVQQMQRLGGNEGGIPPETVDEAYRTVVSSFDRVEGGLDGAPKFPQPLVLDFLLRIASRRGDRETIDLVRLTLDRMAAGGIYDQLGGGFHRYSVDAHWLVPHFEKMLYDNALLALVYLHAYLVTNEGGYRRTAEETLEYLLRDLRSPEGAFYSAQDADSEGVEGKFYVWTPEEVRASLPAAQADAAIRRYGISSRGNFEGKTILTAAAGAGEIAGATGATADGVDVLLQEARASLLAVRSRRTPPATDTKVLTSWNALALRALAEAGSALDCNRYLDAAKRCADFLLTALQPNGRLVRSYRDGPSDIPAFLEDYGYLTEALITLYESTGTLDYLDRAEELAAEAVERFWDDTSGIFFDAPAADELIVRPRSLFDNPIPSGNAAAINAFLRLAALTADERYERIATRALRVDPQLFRRAAPSFAYLLAALDFWQRGAVQIAIAQSATDAGEELARTVYRRYLPNRALAVGAGDRPQLLEGRTAMHGRATAFVCRHFVCALPVADPEALALQLDEASSAAP